MKNMKKIILSLLFIFLTTPHFAYMMEDGDPHNKTAGQKRSHSDAFDYCWPPMSDEGGTGEAGEAKPISSVKRAREAIRLRKILSSHLPKEVLLDQIFPSLHHPINLTLPITYWAAVRDLIHNIRNAFVADDELPVLVLEYIETRFINPLIGYNSERRTIFSGESGHLEIMNSLLRAVIAFIILTNIRNAVCPNLRLWQRIYYGVRNFIFSPTHTTFCQRQYDLIKGFLNSDIIVIWPDDSREKKLFYKLINLNLIKKGCNPSEDLCVECKKIVDAFYSDKDDNAMLCLVQVMFVLRLFDLDFLLSCFDFGNSSIKEIHFLLVAGAVPSFALVKEVCRQEYGIMFSKHKKSILFLEYSLFDDAQRQELDKIIDFASRH